MSLNLSKFKQDAKRFRNQPKIFKRLKVLHEAEVSGKLKKTLADYCVSERTYYYWKARYRKLGSNGLLEKSGRGRPRKYVTGKTAGHVKQMRCQYGWGAEVIRVHLKCSYQIELSQYKIHRYLQESGRVKHKRRKKNKHKRTVFIFNPGEYTQVDVKYLSHIKPGHKRYAYNFVDHASRWSYKKIYDSYGPYETVDFIRTVLQEAPFEIKCIQTDNGIEFTNKFVCNPLEYREHALDRLCREHKIRHKLIPKGEKEINGLVEKHHHLDFKECYNKIHTVDVYAINKNLRLHCQWRNQNRRYSRIRWKTPDEYLKTYCSWVFAQHLYIDRKYSENYSETEVRLAA